MSQSSKQPLKNRFFLCDKNRKHPVPRPARISTKHNLGWNHTGATCQMCELDLNFLRASTLLWVIKHLWFEVPLTKTSAATSHGKAMANRKWSAWWQNSNKWLVFIHLELSANWKQKNKEKHVGFTYLHTKKKKGKKKKQNYFTSMTTFSNHWFSKGQKKKKEVIIVNCCTVNLFQARIHQHISTCAPSICGMCRASWSHPPRPPRPSRYTDTHRPLKQDVQKLVFSIKQCRAST